MNRDVFVNGFVAFVVIGVAGLVSGWTGTGWAAIGLAAGALMMMRFIR